MRGGSRFVFQWPDAIGVGAVLLLAMLALVDTPAQALPSFARQTGQPCGTCHTDFPALTPFGRRFKLLGYTTGGGKFRTTPWLGAEDFRDAADRLRGFAKATDADEETSKVWVPPISMMGIVGYTHTQAPLTPPSAPYSTNSRRSAGSGAAPSPVTSAPLPRSPTTRPARAVSATHSVTPGPGTTPIFAMPTRR
jgi:hypothetical protein